jgi:hypothetical protein
MQDFVGTILTVRSLQRNLRLPVNRFLFLRNETVSVSVTLNFPDAGAAVEALRRLSAISHEDRPDVGAPDEQMPLALVAPPPAMDPAVVFGVQSPPSPPAAPAATLPAASTPPSAAAAPTAAPARDSTGIVWDARIHASTKTKTKDGSWTAKRNVDPAFRAQVEADLRGVTGAAAAPAMPAPPPTAPTPAAPAAPTTESFGQYMARVGGLFTTQPVKSHESMTAALVPYGLANVSQLAGRPDLIPQVDAAFQAAMAA